MASLHEVARKLSSVKCPYCDEGYPFELTERVDPDLGSSYVATCHGCACTFRITIDTQKLIEKEPALEERLSKTLCPNCHHQGVALEFRCDSEKQECFYVMSCKECSCTFQEFR